MSRSGSVGPYDTNEKQLALIRAVAWRLVEVPPLTGGTEFRAYVFNVLINWAETCGVDYYSWYSTMDLAHGARVILEAWERLHGRQQGSGDAEGGRVRDGEAADHDRGQR